MRSTQEVELAALAAEPRTEAFQEKIGQALVMNSSTRWARVPLKPRYAKGHGFYRQDVAQTQHTIAAAIRSGNVIEAAEAMQEHIEMVSDASLLKEEDSGPIGELSAIR